MLSNWRMNPTVGGRRRRSRFTPLEAALRAGHPFPVVLLDAQMAGMDGFMSRRLCKIIPRWPVTVILMLSADRHLVDAARCRELGVDAS